MILSFPLTSTGGNTAITALCSHGKRAERLVGEGIKKMVGFEIVNTHPDILKYIDKLQRANAEKLSFYPMSCFERELAKNRLLLSLLNNEPCGYLYFGSLRGNVRIHQVCIQYDLRRQLYGALLIQYLESLAKASNAQCVTLRCGFDLDANRFWDTLGYKCVNTVDGGIRRLRRINIWQKALSPMMDLGFVLPKTGSTNATLWRKNKQTGLITQFTRGYSLKEYQKLIRGGRPGNEK